MAAHTKILSLFSSDLPQLRIDELERCLWAFASKFQTLLFRSGELMSMSRIVTFRDRNMFNFFAAMSTRPVILQLLIP